MEKEVDLHRHTDIVQCGALVNSKVIGDVLTVDDIGHSPTVRAPIDTRLYNTNETAAVGHNAVNASGKNIAVVCVCTFVGGKHERGASLDLPAEVSRSCDGSVDGEKDKVCLSTVLAHLQQKQK